MQLKTYFLASLLVAISVSGSTLPEDHQARSLGSIDEIKFYCPDLLNANADTLKLGLAGIPIPGVKESLQLWTSVDIVNAYTKRIEETQATLNALTQYNPDALSFAATLDAERKAGKLRGPLHGLPILLKDVISTGDKMDTTAGSFALVGAKVDESTISKKLRAAGVIVLGKANLSQWSSQRTQGETAGWTATGGQTLGAYVQNQEPRGSSSGSAVGASVGLAWATIGIDTTGSIISPASCNNIVGMKPTVGLTSRWLTIGTSPRQDSVGPMARTVQDAAALLQVIAGKDVNDPYTNDQPAKVPDYMKALQKDSLKGKRIGIPRNAKPPSLLDDGLTDAVNKIFDEAIKTLKAAGAIVVDNTDFASYDDLLIDFATSDAPVAAVISPIDFVAELRKHLSQLKTNPNNITNLRDLHAYTQTEEREQYPEKNTNQWDFLLSFLSVNRTITQDSEFFKNITEVGRRWANEEGITGAMKKYNVDGFILPSYPPEILSDIGGFPKISVPMGKLPAESPTVTINGLTVFGPGVPVGLTFIGEKWSEEKLLGWAYAFEQRTQWRSNVQPLASLKPKTQLWNVILDR